MVRVLSTKEFDTWEKLLPKDYQGQIQDFIIPSSEKRIWANTACIF